MPQDSVEMCHHRQALGTLSDSGHLSCIEHHRRGWPTRLQRRCQTDVAHCHASKRSASPREE